MPYPVTEHRCEALTALLAGLVALLSVAQSRRPVAGWDASVARRVAESLPTVVEWLARPFSWVGGGLGMAVVAAIAAGILFQRGTRLDAVAGVVAYVVAEATTQVVKLALDRPRPVLDPAVELPRTASFPSGHASVSMAVLVVVAAILGGRRAVRAAVVVSLAIGLSRVALGVHWVSDVVAGWALGGAIALAILLARGRLRRRR